MVFARDHDRHPLGLARLGEAVLHLEGRRRPPPRSAAAAPRAPSPATGSKTIRMKKRPSAVECWSASTMLSPASARKPLTRAISPGRSGQASSRRVVDCSAIRGSSRKTRLQRAGVQAGSADLVPEQVRIGAFEGRCVIALTHGSRKDRHGPRACSQNAHIFSLPCSSPSPCRRPPSPRPAPAPTPPRSASATPRWPRSRRCSGRSTASSALIHTRRPPDPRRTPRRRPQAAPRRCSPPCPAASRSRPSNRSPPASPAATRPPSPPTAATAANTSSTSAPGNRSAAPATPPPPPRTSRTTARRCSTSQSGSSPWPVCG